MGKRLRKLKRREEIITQQKTDLKTDLPRLKILNVAGWFFVWYNNFTNAYFFKLFAVSLFSFIFLTFNQSLAEEVNQNAAKERRREELQKELDIKESEIKAIDLELQQLKTKKASLGRDIAIFDAEIKKAKLQIQRLDAEIAKTKTGIVQRTDKIKTLSDKSEKRKTLWRN